MRCFYIHRSRCSCAQTFSNKLLNTGLQFYQQNGLIALELYYLSQQGAGNFSIIVSKGIRATALLLRW